MTWRSREKKNNMQDNKASIENNARLKIPAASRGWWLIFVALIILYFSSAFCGLMISGSISGRILLWAPSGIAVAALIAYGKSLWPAVFIGSGLVGYYMNFSLPIIVGNATAQTIEALIAAGIFYRISNNKTMIINISDLNGLVLASVIGPLIGGIVGISSFAMFDNSSFYFDFYEYGFWTMRNCIGILTFTPLILVWRKYPGIPSIKKKFEDVLLAVIFIALIITGTIFLVGSSATLGIIIFIFLLPYIIFISSRFDLYKLTLVNFVIAVIIILSANLVINTFILTFSSINFNKVFLIEMFFTFELFVTGFYISIVSTNLKKAHNDLLVSSQKFRELFFTSPEAMYLLDKNTLKRMEVNDSALNLLGYTRDEFIEQKLLINRTPDLIKSKLKLGKAGEVLQLRDLTFLKKDGSTFSALVTINFLEVNGQEMIQVLLKDMSNILSVETDLLNELKENKKTIKDITDDNRKFEQEFIAYKNMLEDLNMEEASRKKIESSLRESEEKYRSLVENSMVGIVIHCEGTVVFHNEATRRIIGAGSADEINGHPVIDFVHPEYKIIARERISTLLHGITKIQDVIDEKFIRTDGEIIDVAVLAQTITYEGKSAILVSFLDITELKKAEHKIIQQSEHLKLLSKRLIYNQEQERKKIAQDLHDELGHSMTAVILNLEELNNDLGESLPSSMRQNLAEVIELASQTDSQIHEMSLNLRPMMLEELGLNSTLSWYIRKFKERMKIPTHLEIKNVNERISPDIDTNIFRIVQEGLTNISKHANAGEVWVSLNVQDDEIFLSIRDDGVGFDVQSVKDSLIGNLGMGILGMKERITIMGGSITISSKPGEGCHLSFIIPLAPRNEPPVDI